MTAGVAELWIVDADERTVEVWRPGDAQPTVVRDILRWTVLKDVFAIDLGEVFRG